MQVTEVGAGAGMPLLLSRIHVKVIKIITKVHIGVYLCYATHAYTLNTNSFLCADVPLRTYTLTHSQ